MWTQRSYLSHSGVPRAALAPAYYSRLPALELPRSAQVSGIHHRQRVFAPSSGGGGELRFCLRTAAHLRFVCLHDARIHLWVWAHGMSMDRTGWLRALTKTRTHYVNIWRHLVEDDVPVCYFAMLETFMPLYLKMPLYLGCLFTKAVKNDQNTETKQNI